MTKVRKRFHLQQALDEQMAEKIAGAYSIYGILKITIAPSREDLFVDYDATRLREANVAAALEAAGIPVTEVAPV
jgi:hypothetical protein